MKKQTLISSLFKRKYQENDDLGATPSSNIIDDKQENEDIGPSSKNDIDMQENEDIGPTPSAIINLASSPSTRNKIDLNHLRQNGFEKMLANVTSFCEKNNIKMLDMAESYGNKRNRKYVITNRHHFEVEVFNTVLDMQLQELGSRFSQVSTSLIKNMSGLNPCNPFAKFDISKIVKFSEMYPNDFNKEERGVLTGDLSTFYHTLKEDDKFENLTGLSDLARVMVETGKNETFPLVYRTLKLALVLPVATATVERCFSKMKLIKTDLRNRMGDEYFNNALICVVEKESFCKVKEEDVMAWFQAFKNRRGELI
ncbi:uncharacterized protein LOC110901623 [Helianthus annuus]|uniref:uncharacterized protein LOC110901623 n=1 Tax=Helianthus annuus TaxID=4232 RepID=UPI000B90759D|nr:uncharacterized protein LOC110901623 [Helianthus annuus]